MNAILVWKEQIQVLYARYSGFIIKGLRLILGLLVFGLINSNVGFQETASSIFCTVGLSVICMFLPLTIMVLAATALLLFHFYTLSIAVAIISALIFLLMYIFYFRFAPRRAWLILLTAVSFALKVPLVVPVAIGLLGTPVCLIPTACGTIAYYIIYYVKTSSSALKSSGTDGLLDTLMSFAQQVLTEQEMWVMVAAVVICVLIVYGIRTTSADHAWKIASVSGALAMVIVCVAGNIVLNLHISYGMLAIGAALAIVAGVVLEIMFLSVDYTRTERLEFEDDEYHYYVKAVPKFAVTVPEKNIKHINERQGNGRTEGNQNRKDAPARDAGVRAMQEKGFSENREPGRNAEDILLTQSLNKELGLDDRQK